MKMSEQLARATDAERSYLLSAPIIGRALKGQIGLEQYLAFLTQAYHHVCHTMPLLMAVGARLQLRQLWLQPDLVHYLDEEIGHEQWILNDIAAAGGDADAVRAAQPSAATDALVGYAYDTVMRRTPVGFFGMVFVLEGTSVALALRAADKVQAALGLPSRAFTYLRSHGVADQAHTQHLAGILDRLDPDADLPDVVQCAKTMYWLYGNVFRSLDAAHQVLPSDAVERRLQLCV